MVRKRRLLGRGGNVGKEDPKGYPMLDVCLCSSLSLGKQSLVFWLKVTFLGLSIAAVLVLFGAGDVSLKGEYMFMAEVEAFLVGTWLCLLSIPFLLLDDGEACCTDTRLALYLVLSLTNEGLFGVQM